MKRSWILAPLAAVVALALVRPVAVTDTSADEARDATVTPTDAVTFTRDIAPLLQQHCQECHRPGQIAPFALLSWEQAYSRRQKIRKVVTSRRMPPWKPVAGYGEFHGVRGLSATEIAAIESWVKAGAPQGNPDDLPAPRVFADAPPLGTPDLTLTAEVYTVPGQTGDIYRCLVVDNVFAETRYVTDKLSIELRRGPGNEYKITRNLDAGLALEVIEQTQDGYSRVRVGDAQGTEGWVLTQFLTTERSSRDRLAVAEKAASDSKARAADLERQVAELTAKLGDTKTELDHTRENHDHVSKELSNIKTAAANVVDIQQQNESLRQKMVDRDRQVEELTVANGALSGRSRQSWFIVGASVLFGGIVIGLIAPSLRRKRRSDW